MVIGYEVVDRPGYFGKRRKEIVEKYCKLYGDKWREMWEVDGKFLEFSEAILLYEDAYFTHLSSRPELTDQLLVIARDVYDNSPSNVESGFDYGVQEMPANHYQDIAIRRAVRRLGRKFQGNLLVQIRSTSGNVVGRMLSPGAVPFHLLHLILQPERDGWWRKGTVESFWQSNKVILAKKR